MASVQLSVDSSRWDSRPSLVEFVGQAVAAVAGFCLSLATQKAMSGVPDS